MSQLLKDRGKIYGEFSHNAAIAQALKSLLRGAPNWGRLAPYQQETLDQISSKISRLLVGDWLDEDGWDDIEGYAALTAERVKND